MNQFKKNETLIYIVLAFIFSLSIHLMWQFSYGDNPNYYWNGQLMINTNDGYYFASGVQQQLYGSHMPNPLVPTIYDRGLVFVTYILAKILPFSLDTIIFYMPAIFSSFVVIGLVLIGKLYNNPLWGFLAALIGSIAWSYYNRTLVGYYDTDMFALSIPVFILYFLLKSVKSFELKDMLYTSIFIAIYDFMYLPGKTVTYALGLIFIIYLLYLYFFEKKNKELLLKYSILLFIAMSKFYIPIFSETILKIVLLIATYFILSKRTLNHKNLIIIGAVLLVYFLVSSEALLAILHKVNRYLEKGTTQDSLHFYGVFQTISEASGIPMFPDGTGRNNVAYRVIGSSVGFILFLIGYIALVFKHKEFIIALPLVGIGLFAHWGGLRFTVYAVPIAALSVVYLFNLAGEYLNNKYAKIVLLVASTAALLYPNIMHTTKYNPGTVFSKNEVRDLVKLKNISNPKDYTLAWWDYGYPIWYYSDTISLIDGGKHHEDNFVISKILLSDSPKLAANLAKIAVYKHAQITNVYKSSNSAKEVDEKYMATSKDGTKYQQKPSDSIIKYILKVNQKDQLDPNEFLQSLESGSINLPKKDREVYIYAPFKMSSIFLTISQFSNIDLTTGKKERNIWFYPAYASSTKGDLIVFNNGVIFDYKKGELIVNGSKIKVAFFITTQILKNGDIKVFPQKYGNGGDKVVLFNQNSKKFIIMDKESFKSNYVQMFLLGNYNKELFELVVKSPYSRVYKVK